jgi:hypothetical protein
MIRTFQTKTHNSKATGSILPNCFPPLVSLRTLPREGGELKGDMGRGV